MLRSRLERMASWAIIITTIITFMEKMVKYVHDLRRYYKRYKRNQQFGFGTNPPQHKKAPPIPTTTYRGRA